VSAVQPSFVLSQEELLVLIRLLGTPALPGLSVEALAELPPEQQAEVLTKAERSLKAKQFIRALGEEEVEIDPVVVALVGSCTVPNTSFLATYHTAERVEARYYHIHRPSETIVEHSFPELGFHRFSSVANQDELVEHIAGLLGLRDQAAPPVSPFRIAEETLTQARDIAQQSDVQAVIEHLRAAHLPDMTAQQLAITLCDPVSNGSIVRVDYINPHDREQTEVSGFATLEGPNGLWILRPGYDERPQPVEVSPASAVAVRSQLEQVVKH